MNHTYLDISFDDEGMILHSNPDEGNAILSMRILKLLDNTKSFRLKVVDVEEEEEL